MALTKPSLFALFVLLMCLPALAMQPGTYPETIRALQLRYIDEIHAHTSYGSYARQAEKEGYPNIAHLFRSLAMSEAIHARNFKTLLTELKAKIPEVNPAKIEVGTTRENLKHVTTVEANEIDKKYPGILDRIRPENHHKAIQNITWAWMAEQQHRDLILKIQKAATHYFGLLVGRIEEDPSRYYVCQICGSTLTEIPAKQCPICLNPVHYYKEVPGFPGASRKPDLFEESE
jgi:rubrerythrin